MTPFRTAPALVALLLVGALAAAGCAGKSPNSGPGDDDSFYRADSGDLSDFGVDVVGSGSLDNQSIPASDVTADALTRMERQALKRDPGAKLDTIQFFTLDYDTGSQRPEWAMNVHGRLYLANLDGTNFHSPGEKAGTADSPDLTPVESNAIRLGHCITQAGGDVDRIQRCQKKFPVGG